MVEFPHGEDVDPDGPDKKDTRKWYIKHRGRLIVSALLAAIVVPIGVCMAMTPEDVPLEPPAEPIPAESELAEPTPTPTLQGIPSVSIELAPALAEQYQFYRFSHFLYEYEHCYGEGRPGRQVEAEILEPITCLLYTSPSPRDS